MGPGKNTVGEHIDNLHHKDKRKIRCQPGNPVGTMHVFFFCKRSLFLNKTLKTVRKIRFFLIFRIYGVYRSTYITYLHDLKPRVGVLILSYDVGSQLF